MSTPAFRDIPTLKSYQAIVERFENTKPIRGRSADTVPLARRRDIDRFYIRKVTNPLAGQFGHPIYQCFLYRTPLVTYHPDGSIVLNIGDHHAPSVSDGYFFSELLGVQANKSKDAIVITLRDDKVALTRQNPEATLRRVEGTNNLIADPRVVMGYKLNRKATNNVRGRHGAFYRWLKATVSLREVNGYVSVCVRELLGTVPTVSYADGSVQFAHDSISARRHDRNAALHRGAAKPTKEAASYPYWMEQAAGFVKLIGNDAPETDYYKAFLWLVFWEGYTYNPSRGGGLMWNRYQECAPDDFDECAFSVKADALKRALDKLLFSYLASEVLEYVPLKGGEVPNKMFAKWME